MGNKIPDEVWDWVAGKMDEALKATVARLEESRLAAIEARLATLEAALPPTPSNDERPAEAACGAQEGHDFMWAVQQMREGRKVRRDCWDVNYVYLIDGTGMFYCGPGNKGPFNFIRNDVDSCDWELAP